MVANIVRVGSEEIESNYRNNVAAALVRVIGPFRPPSGLNVCRTLTAEPIALQAGRSSVVRLTARNRRGQPLPGRVVHARGAGVDPGREPIGRGVARIAVLPEASRPRLLRLAAGRVRSRAERRSCVTLLGVLAGKPTQVTG